MTKTDTPLNSKLIEAVSNLGTAFLLNVINPLMIKQPRMTHLLFGMNKAKSNPTQAYLINLLQPVFRSMRKEGKRDTYPWQSAGELSESEIGSLNFRAQPVFRSMRKEGKRDTYDV